MPTGLGPAVGLQNTRCNLKGEVRLNTLAARACEWKGNGCVLNGIFWRLRSGSPWTDIPERYGPYTTCYNRFVRWRKAGVWDKLLAAVSEAYNGKIQMIDSSVVRVHQHAANGEKKAAEVVAWAVPAAGLRPKSTRSTMRAASRSH